MVTKPEKEKVLTVNCLIPEGMAIGKCSFGNSIVATKTFPKGSLMYRNDLKIIPNENFAIDLFIDNKKFEVNSIVHSVIMSPTERIFYFFDSYMNHSCDPNTTTVFKYEELEYYTFARKDIEPGDEITCDYNLIEYDCRDKEIENCVCGAKDCIGEVFGFKFLTIEQKRARYKEAESYIFHEVLRDSDIPKNSFIFEDKLKVPENVDPVTDSDTFSLIAKKDFEKGDIIYKNTSRFVSRDCIIIIQLFGNRIWVDNDRQTLDRGELGREYLGFDSFRINIGEEDKNTTQIYQDSNNYDVVATRQIKVGEKLYG